VSSPEGEEGVWSADRIGIFAVNAVCSAAARGELAWGAISAAVKTTVSCSTINGARLVANEAARILVVPPTGGAASCWCLDERCDRLVERKLLEDDGDPNPESDDMALGGPIDETLEGVDGEIIAGPWKGEEEPDTDCDERKECDVEYPESWPAVKMEFDDDVVELEEDVERDCVKRREIELKFELVGLRERLRDVRDVVLVALFAVQ
jgi:hypothetical protein